MAEPKEKKTTSIGDQPLNLNDNAAAGQDEHDRSGNRELLARWKIVVLILLMPLCTTAIQLPLTPSHGGIPAMEYHQLMFQSCLVVYFAWRMIYTGRALISIYTQMTLIPILAAWIPVIELYLTLTARTIGPAYSAALIKSVTWLPLQGLLLNVVRTSIEQSFPESDFVVGLGALAVYFGADYAWTAYQSYVLSLFYGFIRPYMMFLVTIALVALLPKRWAYWLAVPCAHTLFYSPHRSPALSTRPLYADLHKQGFSMLARTEGITGYLSVLENVQEGYRLMRCDHSILGGNWVTGLGSWAGGEKATLAMGRVAEPIYAVFVMLEAVRLVQDTDSPSSSVADKEAQALNIGLGIGTTPSAFIAHGINTTIVELDPIVHRLAVDYFDLPSNHTAVLEDALTFVEREMAHSNTKQYDYIIHDVFTGGAEPTALFTFEFLFNLKQLLKSDGTIAINYASDLDLPSTKLVINTIIAVFPNCRLFRDTAEEEGNKHVNFVNMVLFCRKTASHFTFRDAINSDYLGTSSRKAYLKPSLELDLGNFVSRDSDQQLQANDSLVLHAGATKELEKWHGLAARRHWEVMRTVMPDQVWELWLLDHEAEAASLGCCVEGRFDDRGGVIPAARTLNTLIVVCGRMPKSGKRWSTHNITYELSAPRWKSSFYTCNMSLLSQSREYDSAPGLFGALRRSVFRRDENTKQSRQTKPGAIDSYSQSIPILPTYNPQSHGGRVLADRRPISHACVSNVPQSQGLAIPAHHSISRPQSLRTPQHINMASISNSGESETARDKHAAKFYANFLSSTKSYGSTKPYQPTSRSYPRGMRQHGARNVWRSHDQNGIKHNYIRGVQLLPGTRGTARSDKQALGDILTWEQFNSQQEEQEEAIRAARSAAIAQENEMLILGDTVSDKESDLLEFSPLLGPTSTPTTSVSTSLAGLEIFSSDHRTTDIQTNDNHTNYLLPQSASTLNSFPGYQATSPTEDTFGNMVLQDLRPFKPLVPKSTTKHEPYHLLPQSASTLSSFPDYQATSPTEDIFGSMVLQDLRPFKPLVRKSTTKHEPVLQIGFKQDQPNSTTKYEPVLQVGSKQDQSKSDELEPKTEDLLAAPMPTPYLESDDLIEL